MSKLKPLPPPINTSKKYTEQEIWGVANKLKIFVEQNKENIKLKFSTMETVLSNLSPTFSDKHDEKVAKQLFDSAFITYSRSNPSSRSINGFYENIDNLIDEQAQIRINSMRGGRYRNKTRKHKKRVNRKYKGTNRKYKKRHSRKYKKTNRK